MVPTRLRDVVGLAGVAALSGVLYFFWLYTPVLDHWTINQWRSVALAATVVIGSVGAILNYRASTMWIGSLLGILLAGGWAFSFGNDLPSQNIFGWSGLREHAEHFWFEILLFSFVAALGACCARLIVKVLGNSPNGTTVQQ
jgi:hypothetical protein